MQDPSLGRTMRHVDRQADALNNQWAGVEEWEQRQEAQKVADQAKIKNPEAAVMVITLNSGYGDTSLAILTEHPPDESATQTALDGAAEIRNPFIER